MTTGYTPNPTRRQPERVSDGYVDSDTPCGIEGVHTQHF